ncbi:hypothetical protein OG394_37705 [Kribbella sp. NBC_01245]|uniref:hypothetical protein n=1 Tax=Kribbella sp. NBC_01245 TaxID=2903578 RepID=UPI002E29EF60|nr:hypothetical protein [Kribbella sp. NBC_01245]
METRSGIPSFAQLVQRVFEESPLIGLHGTGVGVERSTAGPDVAPDRFTFAYAPPDRWRLERPPGKLRAIGDRRREVEETPDGVARRVHVGGGWSGEPASWLLRPSLTGVSASEWLRVDLVGTVMADSVAGRPCWRVPLSPKDGQAWLWFDAELPLLLRIAAGSTEPASADLFAEVSELQIGSTGPNPIDHPLLNDSLHRPITAVPEGAKGVLQAIRAAIPHAHDVELCGWEPTGEFVARVAGIGSRREAELVLDRRRSTAAPYEGTHAYLMRGGDADWCLSIDCDPDLDRGWVRELAKRLPAALNAY